MADKDALLNELAALPLLHGAYKSAVIRTEEIALDKSFRDMCASNACGLYGQCWMCPPAVGEIEKLMDEVRSYDYALVYQTISDLEDSYDFEGMMRAKKESYALALALRKVFDERQIAKALHLGAGGCGVCAVCAKRTNDPCRHPELAMPSLEAYGVNVSHLAGVAGMKYTNGADTVTYFGTVLFSV